jgi:hypothetical protein
MAELKPGRNRREPVLPELSFSKKASSKPLDELPLMFSKHFPQKLRNVTFALSNQETPDQATRHQSAVSPHHQQSHATMFFS